MTIDFEVSIGHFGLGVVFIRKNRELYFMLGFLLISITRS